MGSVIKQKFLHLSYYDGGAGNFIETPGSVGSLQTHLKEGWIAKFLNIHRDEDGTIKTVDCLLEKQISDHLTDGSEGWEV